LTSVTPKHPSATSGLHPSKADDRPWRRGAVDEWTYEPGPIQLVRILTCDIKTARLWNILLCDYGTT
jgi:hypothetical protein